MIVPDPEGNPNCTLWCLSYLSGSRGHAAVPDETARRLREAVRSLRPDAGMLTEEQLREALVTLYPLDTWGYHAVADALGKSHEWAWLVLTSGT